MEQYIICPICHNVNSADAEQCAYCGQRFKPYDLSEFRRKKKFRYIRKRLAIIAAAIIFCAVFFSAYKDAAAFVLSYIVPPKPVSIMDMTAYVYQDDKYSLPSEVAARMDYGKDKAVSIKWQPSELDSSTSGTKPFIGKVQGYERLVELKLTVMPVKVMDSLNDCTTESSMVDYNIKVDKNIKQIKFSVNKIPKVDFDLLPQEQSAEVKDGVVKIRVYFPFGPGNYKVGVLTARNDDKQAQFYTWKVISVTNNDIRDMRYLMPAEYVQSDSPEIIKLAHDITKDCYSDMEKTLAIHDWICTHIAYDTAALNGNVHEYSAVETYEGRKAVCSGYANLTAALNRAVGIKTKIIEGLAGDVSTQREGHAWNETYIDGRWIIQDTTWDAGYIDIVTKEFVFRLSHNYFNPSPVIFRDDHSEVVEEG